MDGFLVELSAWLYMAIGVIVVYLSGCYEHQYFRGKNDVSGTTNLFLVLFWPILLAIIIVTIIYQFIKSLFK
ncbi:hypothetical protein I4P25_11255 [Enterobacter hormaechei]|nr:hypothetical protein [Enterobacter hormaechei]